MPPKTRPPAPGAPVGERLARIETLLEEFADRQQEQHGENVRRQEQMATETKEHRHRTANALQEVTGRLARIEATSATQAATIADILEVKAPAAAEDRQDLRDRLEVVESIVSGVKMSWKVGLALVGGIGALLALGAKVAGFFGWKL